MLGLISSDLETITLLSMKITKVLEFEIIIQVKLLLLSTSTCIVVGGSKVQCNQIFSAINELTDSTNHIPKFQV